GSSPSSSSSTVSLADRTWTRALRMLPAVWTSTCDRSSSTAWRTMLRTGRSTESVSSASPAKLRASMSRVRAAWTPRGRTSRGSRKLRSSGVTGPRDSHGPGRFETTNLQEVGCSCRPAVGRQTSVARWWGAAVQRIAPGAEHVPLPGRRRCKEVLRLGQAFEAREHGSPPLSVVIPLVGANLLAGCFRRPLLLQLLHSLADECPLELREVVHERRPLQMVDLVLEDVRQPPLGRQLLLRTGPVLVAHPDLGKSRSLLPLVGNGQAP